MIFKEQSFPFADLNKTCMEDSRSVFSTTILELLDDKDIGQAHQPNICGHQQMTSPHQMRIMLFHLSLKSFRCMKNHKNLKTLFLDASLVSLVSHVDTMIFMMYDSTDYQHISVEYMSFIGSLTK